MKPPRFARFVARLSADREDVTCVLDDMDRRFRDIADRSGRSAARRWYWSQVFAGLVWRARPDFELFRRRAWEGAAGDLRIGTRALLRRPAYAVGVVGTLALGLASASLVFTIAWRVWLSPMPFPDPDRVVRFYETEPVEMGGPAGGAKSERRWRISPPLLEDMRSNSWDAIELVAGVSSTGLDWLDGERTRRVTALQVSPEAFAILGIVPARGRLLRDDEAREVLLTREFWERSFGADPDVVGAAVLTLDGISRSVVGVVELPAGYPRSADLVTALDFDEEQLTEGMRGARYLDVVGRVRAGHGVDDAEAEAHAFFAALGETHPQHDGWGADVVVLGDNLIEPYRGVLALLLAAGLTFLALAVVNVGGLVAARRAETLDDRAVRLALGASEGRLLRSALLESVLLGGVGAGTALLVAHWLVAPIRRLVPEDIPRIGNVAMDLPIAASVVGAGLLIGAAVGAIGYAMSRGGASRPSHRRSTSPPGLRGRQYLVAGQVAMTTLLTTGGVTILRHVFQLRAVDTGFEPTGVLMSPSALGETRYPAAADRLRVWTEIEERLLARGITAAVAVNTPMSGSNMPYGFRIDASAEQAFAQYHSVSDRYFEALGIEAVEGRTFGPADHRDSEPVLLVSEAVARTHFPDGAVGRTMLLLNQPKTIIGVVASTNHFGPDTEAPPEIYVPLEQDPWAFGTILMKSDREDATAILAEVVQEVDPALDVPRPQPYGVYLETWYAPLRLQLLLVGGLALLGLTLASLGLYALVSYHVSTRRRDIGIRIALGAPGDRVFRSVMGQGIMLALAGGTLGLVVWYTLAPRVTGIVQGIDATDPLVPGLVVVVVGGACALATVLPAWRSTAVDPAATLKAD